jgi:hypothetical protein
MVFHQNRGCETWVKNIPIRGLLSMPKPPLNLRDQNPGKIYGKIDLGKVGRYNAVPFEDMSLLMP